MFLKHLRLILFCPIYAKREEAETYCEYFVIFSCQKLELGGDDDDDEGNGDGGGGGCINLDRGDLNVIFMLCLCAMRKTSNLQTCTRVHDLNVGGQQNFYFLPKEVLTMTIEV